MKGDSVRLMPPSLAPPLARSSICNAVNGGHASGPRATRHEAGNNFCKGQSGSVLHGGKFSASERLYIRTRSTYTIVK
jgi:hypothetical protein